MVMLVTLQEASDHLRRDTTDDDGDLTLKIQAVSRAILNYLKDDMLAYQFDMNEHGKPLLDSNGDIVYLYDSDGELVVRDEVKAAVLMMIGVLYKDRDAKEYTDPRSGGGLERLGNMSLPRAVHWILDPLRLPTLR